jgi:lipopolysaccharide/colanic/teichoic acid biosynthesis glycosyltransferase
VETLGPADITTRGTYWYDLRARDPLAAGLKRVMDVAVAAPLLVLVAPVLLFRDIVRERRVGFRGHEFDAFVFRSGGLRALPQLINVLDGSMSLVGPRPVVVSEVAHQHARRFSVQPGMTGLWRVEKGRESELDRAYVNEWSLRQDLAILMKTVLRPEGPRR